MTRKVLVDKQLYWSFCSVIFSVPSAAGGDEGHWDFRGMTTGTSAGREKRREVLDSIQGLVRSVELWLPTTVYMLSSFQSADYMTGKHGWNCTGC